jgi:hypothetical protein
VGANEFGDAGTGHDAVGAKSNSGNRNPQQLLAANPVLDIYPPASFADQPESVAMHHVRSPHTELILHPPAQPVPPIVHVAAAARTKLELG